MMDQPLHNHHFQPPQTELDEDTKYLMEFHQQIIPSQSLVNLVQIVHSNLKCSLVSVGYNRRIRQCG